jgi:hypothetical protein
MLELPLRLPSCPKEGVALRPNHGPARTQGFPCEPRVFLSGARVR